MQTFVRRRLVCSLSGLTWAGLVGMGGLRIYFGVFIALPAPPFCSIDSPRAFRSHEGISVHRLVRADSCECCAWGISVIQVSI